MKSYHVFEIIRDDYKPVKPLFTASLDTGKALPAESDLKELLDTINKGDEHKDE